MPELPEVETVRLRLTPQVKGKSIIKARVINAALRQPVTRGFARKIADHTIEDIERRAKYLLIRLSGGLSWLVHLGMSGRLHYSAEGLKPQKYTCVWLQLQDGSTILHNDIRRFGLSLLGDDHSFAMLQSLGVEPLESEFSASYLFKQTQKSTRTIKNLIMHQPVVVGVGNIYANEALFLSKILPTRRSNEVSKPEVQRLVRNIKKVLHEAIHEGGSSINDFLDSEGASGSYQDHFLVYSQAGRPCTKCKGTIEKITHDGRSSFICRNCQK